MSDIVDSFFQIIIAHSWQRRILSRSHRNGKNRLRQPTSGATPWPCSGEFFPWLCSELFSLIQLEFCQLFFSLKVYIASSFLWLKLIVRILYFDSLHYIVADNVFLCFQYIKQAIKNLINEYIRSLLLSCLFSIKNNLSR